MCSGVIWKTIFTEHSLTLHQEMPLESLLRKENGLHQFYVEMPGEFSGPELISDGLEESGRKWNCFCFWEKMESSFQSKR